MADTGSKGFGGPAAAAGVSLGQSVLTFVRDRSLCGELRKVLGETRLGVA